MQSFCSSGAAEEGSEEVLSLDGVESRALRFSELKRPSLRPKIRKQGCVRVPCALSSAPTLSQDSAQLTYNPSQILSDFESTSILFWKFW